MGSKLAHIFFKLKVLNKLNLPETLAKNEDQD